MDSISQLQNYLSHISSFMAMAVEQAHVQGRRENLQRISKKQGEV